MRTRHARFIGFMFVAPFFVAASAVMLVTASLGASITLATILAVFGMFWLAALLVSVTGRDGLIGGAVLAVSALVIGVLVAFSGGVASPMALLLAVPAAEAFWVSRSRRWLVAGVAASVVAGFLGAFIPLLLKETGMSGLGQPAFWHWLAPLAWAATFIPRKNIFHQGAARTESGFEPDIEKLANAALLYFNRQGDVLNAGAHTHHVLGLAPDLMLGEALFERIHIADRIGYLNALADMRDGAEKVAADIRLRLPKVAGEDVGFRSFILELHKNDAEGDVFLGLLRDNCELVSLRQALDEAQENVVNAEVTKSRFLAAVSHELRTPLNAILGFSDMLLHEMFGPFKDPRQKEYVTLVRDSGQHLLEVVTSILDVSRIEAGAYRTNPEPFCFMEAAEMCRSMMQLQAENKDVKLEMRVTPDMGDVNGDRRAIQQILINLASNAIKFTPQGGQVMIGAQRVGSRLHFWVSDTGIGIAQDDLARIGQPFVQVQNDYTRSFEGAGLGLSLVKGLVKLHEGTFSIDSVPGEGTTVSISIPVDGPQADKDRLVVLAQVQEQAQAQAQAAQISNKNEKMNGSLRKTG
ncbi:ATP-binding protein [Aquamicrobium segne]|uniref:histidine kinase n=1 Tax=Aquamicrobium segne TaxID=469547 RepID=A0ABW0GVR9_9HYPH